MTRLSLVRHGQTDWNRRRRIQGTSDIPLNEAGRQQARRTGEVPALRTWDRVVSSPLSRAMETARIIAARVGLGEPHPLRAIAERAYGSAEGLTGEEILDRFPEGVSVPGQEPRASVFDRAHNALIHLAEENPGDSVIVVTHGGVISTLVRRLTDHALPAPGDVIPNGSVHEFVYLNGELRLDRFHLGPEDRDLFTSATS